MKYIKRFESEYREKVVYAKDYVPLNKSDLFKNSKYDKILDNIKKIKDLNIKYEVYYFNSDVFGLLFKVLVKDELTGEQCIVLENLEFFSRGIDYQFTFEWIQIEEDMIDDIIMANKYNL